MSKININSIIRKCSFLALSGLLASCVTDSVTNDQCEKSSIILNFTIPTEAVSRAETGGVTDATTLAKSGEATIKDMKVWVFAPAAGDDAVAERYSPFEESAITQKTDNSVSLSIGIPRGFSKCDLYILANSSKTYIGGSLNGASTRAEIEAATFASVPLNADNGLPLARIVKNVDVSSLLNNDNASLNIALLRSVSKINLFFSKDATLENTGVVIKSIFITNSSASLGSVFPQSVEGTTDAAANAASSNVPATATFATTTFPIANSITSQNLPYTVSKSVSGAITKDPGETGDEFLKRMTTSADLVESAYFLESNRAAQCTIEYTVGGEEKERTFELWSATSGADLIRNHNVVIYGHFVGRDLYVTPTVLAWNDAETINYDLSEGVNATVTMNSSYVACNTDHIAAAYDESSTGSYYPQFTVTFVTPVVDRWLLQSSNPNFGFKINLNDDIQDYIEGVGGKNNSVTFYVVPKNEFDQSKFEKNDSQYYTTLFVTVPEIPSLGRVTFNDGAVKLPGTTQGVTVHQISKGSFDNGSY
jgi:hypothetical protein